MYYFLANIYLSLFPVPLEIRTEYSYITISVYIVLSTHQDQQFVNNENMEKPATSKKKNSQMTLHCISQKQTLPVIITCSINRCNTPHC